MWEVCVFLTVVAFVFGDFWDGAVSGITVRISDSRLDDLIRSSPSKVNLLPGALNTP
jgi:hypothetical protein